MKYEVKKVLSKKVLCDCCGEEHSISEMSPVFAKVNGKFIETDRFLCKECLSEIDSLDGYAQCGDCKRVFDLCTIPEVSYSEGYVFDFYVCCEYPNNFVVYSGDRNNSDLEYLCLDCEGKHYSECIACQNPEWQCIRKSSCFDSKFGCPGDCVDLVKALLESKEGEDI